MASWRRITGIAGLAVGAVAAGAGAALAAEKVAVGRLRLRPDPEADEPFGQLHGRALTVVADDGVPLHAEINGPDDAPVTVVFCHGYTLSQDVWHYQRRDLAAAARLVFWDQRGHGRSGQCSQESCTISYEIATGFAGRLPRSYSGVTQGMDPVRALATAQEN